MSDFLLNLARRSAGLAPVVRARAAMPVAAVAPERDAPAPERPMEARASSPAAPAASAPVGPGAPIAPADAPRIAVPAAPPVSTPPAAPLAQRAVASALPPVAPPVAPLAPASPAPAAVATPRALFATESPEHAAPRSPALAHVQAGPPSAPPAARVPDPAIATAIVPAEIARVAPPELPPHREAPHDIAREDTRVSEEARASVAVDAPPLAFVSIQPAELAAVAPPAPRSDAPPDRTVHVRIGAIEIVGAEPAVHTPAPSAPAVAPPSAPRAASAGGFEEYASLRRYAPWSW